MSFNKPFFELIQKQGEARLGKISTKRGNIETPAFMPVGTQGTIKGIFTDGDLRRALNKKTDVLELPISQLMSNKAKTITNSSLATEAIEMMQRNQIYSLVVTNNKGQPEGLIRMHDLVETGLV